MMHLLPVQILYPLVTLSLPTIESTMHPTLQLALFLIESFMSTSTPFLSSTPSFCWSAFGLQGNKILVQPTFPDILSVRLEVSQPSSNYVKYLCAVVAEMHSSPN